MGMRDQYNKHLCMEWEGVVASDLLLLQPKLDSTLEGTNQEDIGEVWLPMMLLLLLRSMVMKRWKALR